MRGSHRCGCLLTGVKCAPVRPSSPCLAVAAIRDAVDVQRHFRIRMCKLSPRQIHACEHAFICVPGPETSQDYVPAEVIRDIIAVNAVMVLLCQQLLL